MYISVLLSVLVRKPPAPSVPEVRKQIESFIMSWALRETSTQQCLGENQIELHSWLQFQIITQIATIYSAERLKNDENSHNALVTLFQRFYKIPPLPSLLLLVSVAYLHGNSLAITCVTQQSYYPAERTSALRLFGFWCAGRKLNRLAKENSSWLSSSLYRNAFTLPTHKITHSRWKEIHSPWFNGSQASCRKISTHIMEHFSTCSEVVEENQDLSFNGHFSRVVEEYGMGAGEWEIPAVWVSEITVQTVQQTQFLHLDLQVVKYFKILILSWHYFQDK